jgi:hypothetical protein
MLRSTAGVAPGTLQQVAVPPEGGSELNPAHLVTTTISIENIAALVAQVSNLLYRRFPIGRPPNANRAEKSDAPFSGLFAVSWWLCQDAQKASRRNQHCFLRRPRRTG